MMNKGSETDVVAVSCVASYMAVGARGREQLMHEGLAELLVTKALAQGVSGKSVGCGISVGCEADGARVREQLLVVLLAWRKVCGDKVWGVRWSGVWGRWCEGQGAADAQGLGELPVPKALARVCVGTKCGVGCKVEGGAERASDC